MSTRERAQRIFVGSGRRLCAITGACSAVMHLLMLDAINNLGTQLLLAAMAMLCLYCARDLWQTDALRPWCAVALMNLAMIAAHWSLPHCDHTGTTGITAGPASNTPSFMVAATVLAAGEAAVAAAVVAFKTRQRGRDFYTVAATSASST
jgi:hypothetical protein